MTREELRTKRLEAALTQAELAQLLDFSTDTVRHWEDGRFPITRRNQKALREFFRKIARRKERPLTG